jgi:hypothetical protein
MGLNIFWGVGMSCKDFIWEKNSWRKFWDRSVGITVDYGLEDRGSILGRDKRFFSSLQRSGRLRVPHNRLSNWYQGWFPGGKVAESWSWQLTSIQCLGLERAIPPHPVYLHGIMLNCIIKYRNYITFIFACLANCIHYCYLLMKNKHWIGKSRITNDGKK